MPRIARIAAAVLFLAAPPALAETPAPSPEKAAEARGDFMRAIGRQMKTINIYAKGQGGSWKETSEAGRDLHALTIQLPSHFPPGSAVGDSEAKPEIWTSWPDFTAKATALTDAAAKLAVATQGTDIPAIEAAFRETAATCKSCHRAYRK